MSRMSGRTGVRARKHHHLITEVGTALVLLQLIAVPFHLAFDHHHHENALHTLADHGHTHGHTHDHTHDHTQQLAQENDGRTTLHCHHNGHDDAPHHSHPASDHDALTSPRKPSPESSTTKTPHGFTTEFTSCRTIARTRNPVTTQLQAQPRLHRELSNGSRAPPLT